MSPRSQSPFGPHDPYAPKRIRDQEQTRPRAERRLGSRLRERNDDLTQGEAQIAWLRMKPAATLRPPPEPPQSLAGQLALLGGVSFVSALAVFAFYKFVNPASPPRAAPRVAASVPRPVQTLRVKTLPLASSEEAGQPAAAAPATVPTAPAVAVVPAAPAPVAVAAAAPAAQAPGARGPVRGVTDSEILLGIAAPLSGAAKELGRQMKLGLDTAFAAINDAGGINGRHLRLTAVDDGFEPSRALGATKTLVEKDGVFGIVGNVGTATAQETLPYALRQKVLFFGAFTGAELLRRDPPDRYVFNYRASYGEETEAAVNYLVKVRQLKSDQIAVLAQQDGGGEAGYAGVVKAVRALNGDPAKILRLTYPRNTVDVEAAVAAVRAHKTPIKAVIMVAAYRVAAKFIEKTHDLGMIYTNVSFVGSTALAEELMLLGPRYANGVIVTQVVPAIEGYSSFVLDYKNALAAHFPGERPDYVSLEGYVVGNLLAEGLRRTGPQVDTEKLVDALESLRDYDIGLGTPLTFGRTEHQASHKIWGTRLGADGQYQPFDMQ